MPFWLGVGVTWMYSYCRLLFRGQVTLWKFLELERGTFHHVCASAVEVLALLTFVREKER